MAKNFFHEGKEITKKILEHLENTGAYSDELYYIIDIYQIEEEQARVCVGDREVYLLKQQGEWSIPA